MKEKRLVIVGAGYAGLCLAYAALKKDFVVTLLDAASDIATQASSHPSAVTFPTLSALPTPLSQMSLRGREELEALLRDIHCPSRQTGLLKIADNEGEERRWRRFIETHNVDLDDFALFSPEQCERRTGVHFGRRALWMPWIRMVSLGDLCRKLKAVMGDSITTCLGWKFQTFVESNREVLVVSDSGISLRADYLVLACPSRLYTMSDLSESPRHALREIQGRVIDISVSENRFDLPFILNFKRHWGPSDHRGWRSLGASQERVILKDGARFSEQGGALQSDEHAAAHLASDLRDFLDSPDMGITIHTIWTQSRYSRAGQEPLCGRLDGSQRVFLFSGFGSKATLHVPALTPKMIDALCGSR